MWRAPMWTLPYSFLLISRWHLVRWWCVGRADISRKVGGVGDQVSPSVTSLLSSISSIQHLNTPSSLSLSLSLSRKLVKLRRCVILSELWNFVKIVKFCPNCEILFKLWNFVKIVKFCQNSEILSKLWCLLYCLYFERLFVGLGRLSMGSGTLSDGCKVRWVRKVGKVSWWDRFCPIWSERRWIQNNESTNQ